jgi:hypothetical protein
MFTDDTAMTRKDSISCGWRSVMLGWRFRKPANHFGPKTHVVLMCIFAASCCASSHTSMTGRHMATSAHASTCASSALSASRPSAGGGP